MSGFMSVVSFVAVAYGAMVLLMFFYQPHLLYFPDMPNRDIVATPDVIGLEYAPVTLTTGDDIRLDAWFVPAQQERGVVLFCHGNAGNISHRLDSLRIFNALGLSVLIFDYRGYGRSDGKPSEQGTYRDTAAAWEYLVEQRQVPPDRIILFGRSLGAAIVAELASRNTPGLLIIESAFTSVPDMAATLYPWLPVRLLSRYRYDTARYLETVTAPVLVIHSREDEIIPFSNGEQLFSLAGEPKQFLELRGGHNDGFIVTGHEYIEALDRFIEAYLGRGPSRAGLPG